MVFSQYFHSPVLQNPAVAIQGKQGGSQNEIGWINVVADLTRALAPALTVENRGRVGILAGNSTRDSENDNEGGAVVEQQKRNKVSETSSERVAGGDHIII